MEFPMTFYLSRGAAVIESALILATITACTEPTSTVLQPGPTAVHRWESNASVHWNELARSIVASTGASTPFAIRGYALLSIAQYEAAIAAEQTRERGTHASVHAAVSAASAAVMTYLFPAQETALEAHLVEYLGRPGWPGSSHENQDLGEQVGRTVAARFIQRAAGDNFFAPWTGSVPTGPGMWYSSTVPPSAPAGAGFGQARTYLLRTSNQFRPAPPPAFGSAAFTTALEEVRTYSDNRTPVQDSIAKFWHLPPGTYAPPGYWNEDATKMAVRFRLSEMQTAHVLALMNMVMYDALLASHEAKYTYWLLRPSQADNAITVSVGLPNFPAYPSNHAAISAGAARILARAFPAERTRLEARAEEAALSRVLGGIHYRFDGETGLALGRAVAAWAIVHDVKGHESLTLR
jgi:hypothetical protein